MGTWAFRALPQLFQANFNGETVDLGVFVFVGNPPHPEDPSRLRAQWTRLVNSTNEFWANVIKRPGYLVQVARDGTLYSGAFVYQWNGKSLFFHDGSGEINVGKIVGVLVVNDDGTYAVETLEQAHLYLIAPRQHQADFLGQYGTYYKGADHFQKWIVSRGQP